MNCVEFPHFVRQRHGLKNIPQIFKILLNFTEKFVSLSNLNLFIPYSVFYYLREPINYDDT